MPKLLGISLQEKYWAVGAVVIGTIFILKRYFRNRKSTILHQHSKSCVKAHEKLDAQTQEFGKREILEVTSGVWVAIGYGIANTIMIEGNDGIIIVDCLESVEAARDAMVDLHKVCSKPVIAIIYTHNHQDHIGGTEAYFEYAPNSKCDVYAHDKTIQILKTFMTKTGSIAFIRAGRQFGQFLPQNQHINSGIGPCLRYDQESGSKLVMPTITFSKEMILSISGVSLRLIHAPGETDDQIVVYLPDKEVLCAADNIYKAFPNLYAIRGTPSRDAKVWADSLQLMCSLNAQYMVPSHTRPLVGKEKIAETLQIYRDAIMFVHDQTLRWMNVGYFLDDIVPLVQLPPHLRDHPYLQEYYGTVAWSVRGVFTTYLGWFGGDPAYLHPLSPPEQACKMQQLAGGAKNLLATAQDAMKEGDAQWALVCSQSVMRANQGKTTSTSEAEDVIEEAKIVAIDALHALAEGQISANGRHYYLTYALELSGSLNIKPARPQVIAAMQNIGAVEIVKMLPCRLKGDLAAEVTGSVTYRFPDISASVVLEVRKGVAHAESVPYVGGEEACTTDFVVTVDSGMFLDIASGVKNKTAAVLSGDMKVYSKGRSLSASIEFKRFMEYFDDASATFNIPV